LAVDADASLERFSAPVRAWFSTTFVEPTAAQAQGWAAIAEGEHTLILAPTGSGKTLASFLWGLDRLTTTPPPADEQRRTRLVYLSPLRALAVDVEKNLRAPLQGIALAAERLGEPFHAPTVGMRTGDTAADERRKLVRHPPDLLITTPESLYLMLTSQARETLRGVEAVIVDEIHAVAATKRGTHLALTLERLEALVRSSEGRDASAPAFQRIGLSATQRPLDEIARFLGGYEVPSGHNGTGDATGAGERGGAGRRPRHVHIVDAGVRKPLEIEVVVPVEDMGSLGELVEPAPGPGGPGSGPAGAGVAAPPATRHSIWPSIHPRLVELVAEHRSTLIFVNARRLAERLATRLNELYVEGESRAAEAEGRPPPAGLELVKAHHGSLSRERRLQIEDELKSGRLKGLVATSSLELGIDMGAVDLVIQVESPGAVSRGLQRIGRAGHQVGEPSRGKVFPKHRHDLVEAATVVDRMHHGLIEQTRIPRNPLDVLAQQIVAMAALDEWPVAELAAVVRGAAPFADLSDEVLANVLDLLSGRYPSDEFAELRPRIVWDRVADVVRGRAGAQRLAVTSGGTIPDRGLFGVFLPDGTRVGELDEEMVYESRPGETFLLGASTWRIEDITHERVVVTPAPGEPGKMPFWHGDGPGRPLELGRAMGELVRTLRAAPRDDALATLREGHGLDELAARNLLQYLDEQAEATGGVVPDDRTIVVERFRDEIGDWRVCILTPFGAQVHAPWAMAIQARLAADGHEVELMWSDDGIVLRLPEAWDELAGEALPAGISASFTDEVLIDPDEVHEIVVGQLPATSMFASRFRECAARALLLPRRRPDRRTPLWQQRQKAADLLGVAARYPDFPILLETTRECLNDVFDLPALREVLGDLRSRRIRVVSVETPRASPFAQSLLFGWIAVYMYEGDAPLAERRAAALALDRDLLRDLLGAEELRELIDPVVLADLELELQRLVEGRQARDVDEVHDLLRTLGPMSQWEIDARCALAPSELSAEARVAELVAARRAFPCTVAGEAVVAAAEDASRLRDALGVALPPGLPVAFTDPVADPLGDLVSRFARTHGPFLTAQVAARLGVPVERVLPVLDALEAQGRVVRGEFRPEGVEREWCDEDVLRRLRRRSLASLRREVEPVDGAALARFLPEWQGVGAPARGLDALVEVIGSLQGAALPASVLEADVLGRRVAGYRPADLDALCTSGDVVWVGAGGTGARDGRVRLLFRDQASLLAAPPVAPDGSSAARPGPDRPGSDVRGPGGSAPVPDAVPEAEGSADEAADGAADGDAGAGGERGSGSRVDDRSVVASALRAHLAARGASFWPELVAAVAGGGLAYDDATVLDALWDLVWAGEVTNDSLAPVRAYVSGRRGRGPGGGSTGIGAGGARRGPSRSLSRRPNLGRVAVGSLSRQGPPQAAGRWSLVEPLLLPRPAPTEITHAQALQLLERYGVLTREAVLAEGVEGGFAGVYPILKALEERGHVRRGYFVAGLGAAQFALPGAVDRLRAARDPQEEDPEPLVLAATDPAQAYGAALPWPESAGRPARAAGALVVLVAGEPAAYLERGGHSLVTFPAARHHHRWPEALVGLVKEGRARKLELTRIDGGPVSEAPAIAEQLRAAGFVDGYKGLVLRP
jgi:ATP-dependent Lhr-like helicase